MSRLPEPPPTAAGAGSEAIGQLIRERTVPVAALWLRAAGLSGWTAPRGAGLDTPWAGGLRVANFRAGTLVLFADNGATAMRAKLSAPEILKLLNRHHALQCRDLVIKTRPDPRLR